MDYFKDVNDNSVSIYLYKMVDFYEEYLLRPDSCHKSILNVETKTAPKI